MADPLPNVTCPVCHALPGRGCTDVVGQALPTSHPERDETTPAYDALAAEPLWDLDAVRDRWLRECGACDAGMATTCVCPDGDPRTVILALVTRVEAAEARLAQVLVAARG